MSNTTISLLGGKLSFFTLPFAIKLVIFVILDIMSYAIGYAGVCDIRKIDFEKFVSILKMAKENREILAAFATFGGVMMLAIYYQIQESLKEW